MDKREKGKYDRARISRRAALIGMGSSLIAPMSALANQDKYRARVSENELIHKCGIKEEIKTIRIGGAEYQYSTFEKVGEGRNVFLVLHDSESAARRASLECIAGGGKVVAINNGGSRYVNSPSSRHGLLDTNRIFNKGNKLESLAEAIVNDCSNIGIHESNLIFSVHTNVSYGPFSISNLVRNSGGVFTHMTLPGIDAPDADDHNMIIITGTTKEPTVQMCAEAIFYATQGCNVVYEWACKEMSSSHANSFSWFAARSGVLESRTIDTRAKGPGETEDAAVERALLYIRAVESYNSMQT